jgi:hypothetical protein
MNTLSSKLLDFTDKPIFKTDSRYGQADKYRQLLYSRQNDRFIPLTNLYLDV